MVLVYNKYWLEYDKHLISELKSFHEKSAYWTPKVHIYLGNPLNDGMRCFVINKMSFLNMTLPNCGKNCITFYIKRCTLNNTERL